MTWRAVVELPSAVLAVSHSLQSPFALALTSQLCNRNWLGAMENSDMLAQTQIRTRSFRHKRRLGAGTANTVHL